MNPAETSRMQLLARAGLALAACLLLLPTPGHAVTLNVTDDAFISLSNTGKNFGSRFSVKVDGLIGREGFAKFDLSVLGGATASDIDSAILRLWITKVKVAGSIDIHRVIDIGGVDWTEDSLTGDDLFGGDSLSTVFFSNVGITSSDKGSFILVDVTSLVKAWVTTPADNDGISLLPVGGTRVIIDSKEGKKTSHPMEIEVILGASSSIIGGGTGGVAPAIATNFVPMFDGDVSATESDIQQVMPVAGTVKNFNVSIDTTPAAGGWTFTVHKNGADAFVFCIIPAGLFTCSDPTGAAFAAGDLISIEMLPSASPPPNVSTAMRWTAEFTP